MAESNPKPLPELSQKEINRFWGYVDKTPGLGPQGDCWQWLACADDDGYGIFGIRHIGNCRAHRIAYLIQHGTDPGDLLVCHRCDWPPCQRGEHLFADTTQKNTKDRDIKGRTARGAQSGPRLHPERMARGDRNGARTHPETRARGDANGARKHPERLTRGEAVHNSKLTPAVVMEIRQRYASHQGTHRSLAAEYGVNFTTIARIVRREMWQHVTE